MKSREIQKVNSFLSLFLVCRENIAIIATMPAMMANVKLLDKMLQEILSSIEKQAMPIVPITKEKRAIQNELAMLVAELSGIIRSYALSIGDHEANEKFSMGYSQLFRLRGIYLIFASSNLVKFLDENFDSFRDFGLKKDKFEQVKNLHKKFSELLCKPGSSLKARKTQTTLIHQRIAKIDAFVNDQMQTLLPCFSQFPEFCKAFKAARKQIKYSRPKEVLKNKIKKYRSAPALPKTRKSSKPLLQLKPLKMMENLQSDFIS